MTAQEFKEKYPQFAHLEGYELWNKMEEQHVLENSGKNEVVYDWKGNEIKEGHEICLIKIREKESFFGAGIFIPFGPIEEYKDDIEPPKQEPIEEKECWEVGRYSKVYSSEGVLKYKSEYVLDSGWKWVTESPISHFSMFSDSNHIIAIKGISDFK